MRPNTLAICIAVAHLATVGVGSAATIDYPAAPPATEVIEEARAIVAGMRGNDRGPFLRIRWWCNDGAVLPPSAGACREHGGGRQHAQHSPQQQRLAALGYPVGTIFAALSFEDFFDAQQRNQRLRALPLEQFLVDVDDGWVMHRAQFYRGHVQVEDEEAAGRLLLLELLKQPQWLAGNVLLAREVARVVPHGVDTDAARFVRREMQALAEMFVELEPVRVQVHTAPTSMAAQALRRWAADAEAEASARAMAIADAIEQMLAPEYRLVRTADLLAQARRLGVDLDAAFDPQRGADLLRVRRLLEQVDTPQARLLLVDLLNESLALYPLADSPLPESRAGRIGAVLDAADALHAGGLLSARELQAVHAAAARDTPSMPMHQYVEAIAALNRLPQWSAARVRYAFAEALVRFTALDSRAARFADDLLRSSPLARMAPVLRQLNADAQALAGAGVLLFGEAASGAAMLNPGKAIGTLRIIEDDSQLAAVGRDDVVVLRETSAELPPVAAILTLGEGSPLSHVQLLARNFGLPNIAISESSLEPLVAHAGRKITVLADAQGSARLQLAQEDLGAAAELRLTVPAPDLDAQAILPLASLDKALSGRVVGPKAGNLGTLSRLFPGRVAPAVAVPFGVFARHTTDQRVRLAQIYEDHAQGRLDEAGRDAALAIVRNEIAALQLDADANDAIRAALTIQIGADAGVFIRSDTNVEDLPQFTGAGLSLTLPNIVGIDAQIASIPQVWASLLSPRAVAWRSALLTNPADIYASVLLMKSVPSSKSGVLVTTNLANRHRPGVTVSTAWGIGGAVGGEAAETLVLRRDSPAIVLSEARAPYQRALHASGGIHWLPAAEGAVLTASEQAALLMLVEEVQARYEPVLDESGVARPWDIEFGFVDGALTLFQIRPLVERRTPVVLSPPLDDTPVAMEVSE